MDTHRQKGRKTIHFDASKTDRQTEKKQKQICFRIFYGRQTDKQKTYGNMFKNTLTQIDKQKIRLKIISNTFFALMRGTALNQS